MINERMQHDRNQYRRIPERNTSRNRNNTNQQRSDDKDYVENYKRSETSQIYENHPINHKSYQNDVIYLPPQNTKNNQQGQIRNSSQNYTSQFNRKYDKNHHSEITLNSRSQNNESQSGNSPQSICKYYLQKRCIFGAIKCRNLHINDTERRMRPIHENRPSVHQL